MLLFQSQPSKTSDKTNIRLDVATTEMAIKIAIKSQLRGVTKNKSNIFTTQFR